ncbi:MAG TPA: DUF2231 domain-containing protein [Gammaproteobacteria bacterium]|nr:DUF2231 domain-containing protein [Gammaproteobacteria bacterium]
MRHPLHPAIVHFPIACWVLAALLDLGICMAAALLGGPLRIPGVEPAAASLALLYVGDAFALAAIAAGLFDYASLPARVQDSPTLLRHMAWMGAATTLFVGVSIWRSRSPLSSAAALWLAAALELAGALCLVIGGYLASIVVFRELAHGDVASAPKRGLGSP